MIPARQYIPEAEAAEMLGFRPYTFRRKVIGSGRYKDKERMPIAFTTAGKGYRYCRQDIERYIAKSASR